MLSTLSLAVAGVRTRSLSETMKSAEKELVANVRRSRSAVIGRETTADPSSVASPSSQLPQTNITDTGDGAYRS